MQMPERTLGTLRTMFIFIFIRLSRHELGSGIEPRASPISASAGHGERGTYSAFHTGTADSNPGIYSAIYFKSKSTFPFPKNFNQIVHDTNIRHKLLEYLELIFWLEADSKEKWRWTEGFRSHKTGLTGFSFCCSLSIWWKDPHSSKRFKNRDRPTN